MTTNMVGTKRGILFRPNKIIHCTNFKRTETHTPDEWDKTPGAYCGIVSEFICRIFIFLDFKNFFTGFLCETKEIRGIIAAFIKTFIL